MAGVASPTPAAGDAPSVRPLRRQRGIMNYSNEYLEYLRETGDAFTKQVTKQEIYDRAHQMSEDKMVSALQQLGYVVFKPKQRSNKSLQPTGYQSD